MLTLFAWSLLGAGSVYHVAAADNGDAASASCTALECNSLRAAIIAANKDPGSTINLDAAVYQLNGLGSPPVVDDDDSTSGDLDIAAAMTVHGQGAGLTIIDAGGKDRVFDLINTGSPYTFALQSVTIRNGVTSDSGGGIRANGGATSNGLTIEDCAIGDATAGNQAAFSGGGIDFSCTGPTSATVTHTSFEGNSAQTGGGAWVCTGWTANFTDVRFHGNSAEGDPVNTPQGGALIILSDGLVQASHCVVDANTAVSAGGGIFLEANGQLTWDGGAITNNSADQGGAVYLDGGSSARISNALVSGNTAALAGAVLVTTGSIVDFINLTITDNTTSGSVPGNLLNGDDNQPVTTFLANVTLSGNHGGGIVAGSVSNIVVQNSIVTNNGGDCSESLFDIETMTEAASAGTITSQGYNIFGAGCPEVSSDQQVDPLLLPLADQGGSSETLALAVGSPAIDGGNPAGCTDDKLLAIATDQRGVARPSGAACDIGAFESQPSGVTMSVVVSPSTPVGGGSVSYLFVIANAGPSIAAGAEFHETLPSGVTVVGDTPSSGTCTLSQASIDCTLGNLAVGASTTVTVLLAVPAAGADAESASVSVAVPNAAGTTSVPLAAIPAGVGAASGGGTSGGAASSGGSSGAISPPVTSTKNSSGCKCRGGGSVEPALFLFAWLAFRRKRQASDASKNNC